MGAYVPASLKIGGKVGSASSGSIFYADASGNLAQDNANLNYVAGSQYINAKIVVIPNQMTVGSSTPGGQIFTLGDASVGGVYPVMRASTGSQIIWTYNTGGTDRWGVGLQVDGTFIIYDVAGGVVVATFYPGGGVKPTPLTTTQKNGLTAQEGMVVYDTTLHALCVYNGTVWKTVTAV